MAQQPLNTYITKAGIVSTSNQEIYKTKTGYTSIVLYAQVANTGTGIGTVTFYYRRELRSQAGITTTDTEIIKNAPIPDSDSLILLDGRLVLERTATKTDSIRLVGISTETPNHLKYTVSILETLNQ
ncbi:hypothetical protein EBS02_08285 [bacterium]|nr:hypothetical protein [bacterium]